MNLAVCAACFAVAMPELGGFGEIGEPVDAREPVTPNRALGLDRDLVAAPLEIVDDRPEFVQGRVAAADRDPVGRPTQISEPFNDLGRC